MRIMADRDRCEGHGQCNIVDPDLFPLTSDGETAITDGVDVPEDERSQAELGVAACPVGALWIAE